MSMSTPCLRNESRHFSYPACVEIPQCPGQVRWRDLFHPIFVAGFGAVVEQPVWDLAAGKISMPSASHAVGAVEVQTPATSQCRRPIRAQVDATVRAEWRQKLTCLWRWLS